jgi:hypothetical protein
MGDAQSRRGTAFRAIGLGRAGLVVALSFVGCWRNAATAEPIARELHLATLLSDGRVLVAGGTGPSKVLSSAEPYDRKTGAFSLTGPMATTAP